MMPVNWGLRVAKYLNTIMIDYDYFYLSHTQLYREYITSSEMYSLHLTHPK